MMRDRTVIFNLSFVVCGLLVSSLLFLMENFKIGSLNINGARDVRKRAALYELSRVKHIDVLFLQETHSDPDNQTDWRTEWAGQVVLSHHTTTSSGVGFLFSTRFSPLSCEVEHIIEGRFLVVKARFDHFSVVFMNIYAPCSGAHRKMFFNTVSKRLAEVNPEEFLFVGGDFNCTEDDRLDRNHNEPHPASQSVLRQLVHSHDLVDVWRRLHGTQRQYTWAHCRDNTVSLARLDRFYCFKQHFNVFRGCAIVPVGFSDHSLVMCTVFIRDILPKSAYWHFNTALLLDERFKESFIFFWKNFKTTKSDFKSLRQWWDCGKVEVKQLCLQYTLNVSRDITRSMKELEIEIVELQGSAESTGDRGCIESLKSKKAALADLLGSRAQGALVRSRFQSAALMDSPSKYFFSLEKRSGQSRLIHALHSSTGQLLTEARDIRQRAVDFYTELYRSEYVDDQETFDSFCSGLPRVSEEANKELEGPLTAGELDRALQGMQGGKAPGIDGLPAEFFKAFWGELRDDLLEVFNESFEGLSLPQSCRRAVLTLLPKKGDLANRLKEVMDQVVHRTQTYCVPGRSIVDNVSLIRDILEVSGSLGFDAGLVSLDQEKAFDRVEHRYLWKVLHRFGLSSGFIAKTMVLYEGIESVLKINGGLCRPFDVGRGVRQGCSMSGMLYALAIEPMLHNVRVFIDGLFLPGFNTGFNLSAYADDIIVMVKDQKDVQVLGDIVEKFGRISAAKVNWEKSEALAVGRWAAGLPKLPGGLSWRRGGLKYLGVFLGDSTTEQRNWEGVLEKVEGRLEKWRWLLPHMSYRGRVLIINNLVASSLWHKLKCVEPPAALLESFQRAMLSFFWDNLHWVPQSVLYLPKEEGGQGLIHLRSRLAGFRLQTVQRYLTGLDVVWCPVMTVILRGVEGLGLDAGVFLTDCVFKSAHNLPAFYQGLFRAWTLFKWTRLQPAASLYWLLEEPLVHGARLDLQDGSRPGLGQRLVSAGVVRLRQVVEAAGPGFHRTEAAASLLGLRS